MAAQLDRILAWTVALPMYAVSRAIFALRQTTEPRYPDQKRVRSPLRTTAGVIITPDEAVTVPAVWACLRYLSQTVAVCPWRVHQETEEGTELRRSHPVDYLLRRRPNPEWSSFQFRETLTHWALRWGNGYAEIEPDQLGRPFALWPIHPERVKVCRASEAMTSVYGDAIAEGELYYEVNNGGGTCSIIAAARMFHIRGFGEGPVGVNVMEYAAQSIGWAKAAQLFGAAFFGDGMTLPGILYMKEKQTPGGLDEVRKELERVYGSPARKRRTPIFEEPVHKFEPMGTNPEDGQFIETNQYLIEEVCRWFGVPPHKIAHLLRSTNNNIEHQSIEVVQDAITPWAKRFEDEADWKLFGQNRPNFFSKINLRGLQRGDFKSQADGFKVYREMGVVNANEIRGFLDMNKIEGEGGDKYTMQGQYTTLEKIGEAPVVPPPPEPEPRDPDDDEPMPMPDPDEEDAAQAIIRMDERIAA